MEKGDLSYMSYHSYWPSGGRLEVATTTTPFRNRFSKSCLRIMASAMSVTWNKANQSVWGKKHQSNSVTFPRVTLCWRWHVNLKLVKAKKTSLLADLLSNWSNGVIGFGHFSCFPLWHTLFQTVDSLGPKRLQLGLCMIKTNWQYVKLKLTIKRWFYANLKFQV